MIPRRMPFISTAAVAVTLLTLVIGIAVAATETASAHANQLRSSPEPNQELETAPDRVIIWYTEPIEPRFSSISVRDAKGAEHVTGETTFDATEPTAMWVDLGPIPNGTYTVVWRNLSSVDGHKVNGSYLFAVGEALAASPGTVEDLPLVQAQSDPAIRWIIYIGIATFAGVLLIEMLVLAPIARSESWLDRQEFAQIVSTYLAKIALIGVGAVFVAQSAQIIQQSAIVYEIPWTVVTPDRLIEIATQSEWGRFWSWRITLATIGVMALFLALRSRRLHSVSNDGSHLDETPLTTETPWGIAAAGAGGIYLLLIALTSHNAATPADVRWIAIANDLTHMVAATLWIGGLVAVWVAARASSRDNVRGRGSALIELARRFSPVAVVAAISLVATGVVSAMMQVSIPQAMQSPYGTLLAFKVALLMPLIALAAVNRQLTAASQTAIATRSKRLYRYVGLELILAFAILVATAGMASLEPARQYAERHGIGIENEAAIATEIDGAAFDVELTPGSVGSNALNVAITGDDGSPSTYVSEVRARLKFLEDDFGELFVPMEKTADGNWLIANVNIGIAGAYQLDVVAVRTDTFDSNLSFRFSATAPTVASGLIRPSTASAIIAFGIMITIVGVAALVAIITSSESESKLTSRLPRFVPLALIVAGVLIAVNVVTVGVGTAKDVGSNPFPLDQESVSIGRQLYQTTCASCHGDTGRGDGAAGLLLNPPPADLEIHVPLHSDAELYSFVAEGIEGTPMVAQLGNLTPDEIWHIVNFIRTISN